MLSEASVRSNLSNLEDSMLLLLSLLSNSFASEVFWDGHYRSQAHLYRSLSLSNSNSNALDSIHYANHWLSLRPTWKINSKTAVHSQLDFLYLQSFGATSTSFSDPAFSDRLTGFPEGVTDSGDLSSTLRASRVWGEVNSDIGIIRFGRMPVHWGSGMVFNAGNQATQFIGDTADRLQYSKQIDSVFILGAIESREEGFISAQDDTTAGTFALYYATDRISAGLYNVYAKQNVGEVSFGHLTSDIHGKVDLGALKVETEFAFQYGTGSLNNGLDDITHKAFGGLIDASLQMDETTVGLNLGYASGDDDLTDKVFKTFTFDQNYDISLMLFDQVLPTLSPTVSNDINGGLETGAARLGNSISNAIYIQPSVSYKVSETFTPEFSVLLARAAKLPEDESANTNYGVELNANLNYQPVDNFTLRTQIGYLFPGTYLSNYSDPDFGTGFDQNAYGAEVNAIIKF
jgi:hypothetical protein